MLKTQTTHNIDGIEFKVIYSGRRSIGISVLPDSSVIVRVPRLTSFKTISRLVSEKSEWIIRHRDNYRLREKSSLKRVYLNGELHLFRGAEYLLKIEKSAKPYARFYFGIIELGLKKTDDQKSIKQLLYQGYKNEAHIIFPELISMLIKKHENQMLKPSGLIIRSMKRRWGSCSNRGMITLSTELIKLPDQLIEYVIVHELCHLKHHNHGAGFYKLLTELYPDWKSSRKDLRKYIM